MKKVLHWLPAIFRFCLYSTLIVGGVFHEQIKGKSTAEFTGMGWVEWGDFLMPMLLVLLGETLAFFDQTIAKLSSTNAPPTITVTHE